MTEKQKEKLISCLNGDLNSQFQPISKHAYKQENGTDYEGVIFYDKTLKQYKKNVAYFVNYLQENEDLHSTDIRKYKERLPQYIDGYAQHLIDKEYSPFTIRAYMASVLKAFNMHVDDLEVELPIRERGGITRSRNTTVRESHFSERKNANLVSFCRSTGLRRSELSALRSNDLIEKDDGSAYVVVRNGKGGKYRESLIIGTPEEVQLVVDKIKNTPEGEKVWGKVNSAADIHDYRSQYCVRVYEKYARDINTLPEKSLYRCRKDKNGQIYDRKAMLIASKQLGHNRIDVIAQSYLR